MHQDRQKEEEERVRKKTRIELNQEARTNGQKIMQEDNEKIKEANQILIIKEKEMEEKINEKHLKKRKKRTSRSSWK